MATVLRQVKGLETAPCIMNDVVGLKQFLVIAKRCLRSGPPTPIQVGHKSRASHTGKGNVITAEGHRLTGIAGIVGVLGRYRFDDFLNHLGIEIDHLFRVIDTGATFGIDLAGFKISDLHAEFGQYP